MNIVVAVRHAAALDDEFELLPDGGGVDPDFVDYDLNEWDAFSLEEAIRLKEAQGAEVVVVSVGAEDADETLRACLAKGADRAVRIWDDNVVWTDPLVISRLLSALVERESPDLVLCGAQASDTVNGATGAALAGRVDMPCVAVARAVEVSGGGAAKVERELEGGVTETLEVSLPAVLTIQTGFNEPRYATFRAIKQARDKPMEVIGPSDLGIDAEELGRVAGGRLRHLVVPEQEGEAELLDGDADAIAGRIAELIEERVG